MRILLTGTTGFIGRVAIARLSERHQVFGLVREAWRGLAAAKFEPILADLESEGFDKQLPEGVDAVVHLAQSRRYREFPGGARDMRRINIEATGKLLDWAARTNVQRFLFASTANVYGNILSVAREDDAAAPASFYGASKFAAEQLARQYQGLFAVDILRLFTVYGPGQSGTLLPSVVASVSGGREIFLAQGRGVRLSPVFVDDVVEVIGKLLLSTTNRGERVVNVCGDEAMDLRGIVGVVENLIGRRAVLRTTDASPACFVGSNDLLKALVGPMHFVGLVDGLRRTLAV